MAVHPELSPAPKPPHTVLWIVIAIVAGVAALIAVVPYLLLVVGFGIGDRPAPTVGEAFTAAQHFYNAVEQHDYATAYTYLDQHATLTVNGYTSVVGSATALAAIAQVSEQANGAVTGYTPTDGNFEEGRPTVDMTMRVTRSGGSYDVHLKVSLANGKWRIVQMDNI